MSSDTKRPREESKPVDAVLALQEWLKLLAGRGVNMRVAMGLASKIHNTRQRLAELDNKKLTPYIPNKDERRTVVNAVKGIDVDDAPRPKKRARDSDLLEPLLTNQGDDDKPISLEFNEITDPEAILPITITTNRAPVKTAWAYVVCRRLGFDVQESLSIAHVYVHINSLKHALMLGNILNPRETKEAEEELAELPGYKAVTVDENDRWGRRDAGRGKGWKRGYERVTNKAEQANSQPWVEVMNTKPVIEREDHTWRAIEKGIAIPPSQAHKYMTKAFKEFAPHVMGAMKLVADSYTGEDLNRLGSGMYNDFKPVVERWGEKGILQCSAILEHVAAAPGEAGAVDDAEGAKAQSEVDGQDEEREEVVQVKKNIEPLEMSPAGASGPAGVSPDTAAELKVAPDSKQIPKQESTEM